ncbi:MAG: zinc ribbon domain-containing protein [Chloroflexota bacterium]|nr:MAG: zinc ribbon domain-containing protein [Chloroflexota bacterium]
MPIYEYRCQHCKRKSSLFLRSFSSTVEPQCPHCGNHAMSRLISTFAVLRSEDDRLEALSDSSTFSDLDENDPRSIARWARRMGNEMGEDLGPEFDEMVDRMEAGEMPDEAESAPGDALSAGNDLD